MRVSGGVHGGRTLKGPSSQKIRPTSDKLRQAIFNILAHGYGDPAEGARVMARSLGGLGIIACLSPLAGGVLVPLVGWRWALGTLTVFGLALLVLHQLVGDGGHVLHDIHDRTLRQTLVARDQLARADAGIRFAGQGATLAAALGGGLVGQVFGTRSALALAVVAFARRAVLRQT